jgi:hypothetical protein
VRRRKVGRGRAAGRYCEFAGRPGSATVLNAHPVTASRGTFWAVRGRGSAGRASPCQGEGRGFESRRPLEVPGAVSRADGPHGSSVLGPASRWGRSVAEWPSGLGKGLQSPVRGFDSRFRLGRLAQRESASLTRKRSLVQSQYRPPLDEAQRTRAGSAGDPAGTTGHSTGRGRVSTFGPQLRLAVVLRWCSLLHAAR